MGPIARLANLRYRLGNDKPLVTDLRWWFWNLVSTVLTSTLTLGLWCEWYGRPLMQAYESIEPCFNCENWSTRVLDTIPSLGTTCKVQFAILEDCGDQ